MIKVPCIKLLETCQDLSAVSDSMFFDTTSPSLQPAHILQRLVSWATNLLQWSGMKSTSRQACIKCIQHLQGVDLHRSLTFALCADHVSILLCYSFHCNVTPCVFIFNDHVAIINTNQVQESTLCAIINRSTYYPNLISSKMMTTPLAPPYAMGGQIFKVIFSQF